MTGLEGSLESVAEAVLAWLEDQPAARLRYADYHGFEKATLPADVVEAITDRLGFPRHAIQAELVRVRSDLRKEVHYHSYAFALAICLGERQGLDDPRGAAAFIDGAWQPVKAGDRFSIPPEMPHGFTVETGGDLTFLSLQSPPITGRNGVDDYHHVDLSTFAATKHASKEAPEMVRTATGQ
jgi:mannose-6-phosphate isomerase-like protein (cupin superfamily)